MKITSNLRFLYVVDGSGLLCGIAPVNVIKTVLGVQENKRVQQMNPDIHRRTKLLPPCSNTHWDICNTFWLAYKHLKDPIVRFVSNVNSSIALALSSQGINSCSPKFPLVHRSKTQTKSRCKVSKVKKSTSGFDNLQFDLR